MIVLSLFCFKMNQNWHVFLTLLGILGTIITLTKSMIFRLSPGGIVPWRVNPFSPKWWKFVQPQEKLRITFPLKLNPADVDRREARCGSSFCVLYDVYFWCIPFPVTVTTRIIAFLVRVSLLSFTFYCERVGNTPKIYSIVWIILLDHQGKLYIRINIYICFRCNNWLSSNLAKLARQESGWSVAG